MNFLKSIDEFFCFRIQEPFALFDELYDKPWLRAGPYFVGTITGWLLFKTNCKLHTPVVRLFILLLKLWRVFCLRWLTTFDWRWFQWLKVIGWLLSAGIMFSVVYGLYPGDLTVTVSSVYAALGHTAWSIGVAFIVIQCCTGSAAIINSLLSLRLMYPLSRLTYCAYLVHPVIMMVTSTQMDGPLHLHNGVVVTIIYFHLWNKENISLKIVDVLFSLSFTSEISLLPICCLSASRWPSRHLSWISWKLHSRPKKGRGKKFKGIKKKGTSDM